MENKKITTNTIMMNNQKIIFLFDFILIEEFVGFSIEII